MGDNGTAVMGCWEDYMKLLGRAFSTVLAYPKSINVSFLSQTITNAIYIINICHASTMCQDLQQRLTNSGPKTNIYNASTMCKNKKKRWKKKDEKKKKKN